MAQAANPGGRCETHLPLPRRTPARRPYSALLRVGFAMRAALPKPRCALTAPFHPCLSLHAGHRRYALCGTFPRLAPGGRYPPPSFRRARTFLVPHGTQLPSPLALRSICKMTGLAKQTMQSTDSIGMVGSRSAVCCSPQRKSARIFISSFCDKSSFWVLLGRNRFLSATNLMMSALDIKPIQFSLARKEMELGHLTPHPLVRRIGRISVPL